MAKKKPVALSKPGRSKARSPTPTRMGARIIELMVANNLENKSKFADKLGLSRQSFHAWLYKEINPENIAALPLLKCAAELGTNPAYILGESTDARVLLALTYQEAQLVQAFRDMGETDQDRLLKNATDWVGESHRPPSPSAPFRVPHPTTTKEQK